MKVARTVLRGAALGNKCRLLDRGFIDLKFYSWHFSQKVPANSDLPHCELFAVITNYRKSS
ncbi:hypothetical protein VCRA2113O415_680001 [Vibrio crassostreae]|nr:hypothetical protein VCRA2113O415_680001 [Vibrio crassostreae]CAK2950134.1 hypothetical protein VCRA2113O420_640005 [Vibrio crassostreae]CAK3559220.1 hypothetical protein VCRA2121O436_620001 [Vibrio crassostreae]